MPSEDTKAVKANREGKTDVDGDDKSLSSILKVRKKNPTNAGTLISKHRPKDDKVKKEEPQDGAYSIKGKSLSGSGSGSGSGSRPKPAKMKKEENGDDDDHKPISKTSSAVKVDKELIKKKKKHEEEKKGSVVVEKTVKKREKKVYDLPGQKRDPPEERDPIRIFYESLHKQIPKSEMAQIWMMESGLLSKEEAKKIYEMKQKKNNNNKLSSPIKTVTVTKKIQSAAIREIQAAAVKKTLGSPVSSLKKKSTDIKPKKRKVADGSSDDDSDDDFIISRSLKKQRAG